MDSEKIIALAMPDFEAVYNQTRVTPIPGEPLRFHVQSRSFQRVQYLVDLLENDGFGKCGCPQFFYRIQPVLNAIKRGEEVRQPSRCYHILRVREYLADCVILKTGQQQGEQFAKDATRKTYRLNAAKSYAKK